MNKSFTKTGKLSFLFFTAGILMLGSCKKDRIVIKDPIPSALTGVYVLCEDAYGANNVSSITYYDVASGVSDKDYYNKQNGRVLGSNASDLEAYGSKMYCVITGKDKTSNDSYVDVISIATGKSLKRIPFTGGTTVGILPRYVSFYKGKAYVSAYDGSVTKIDTASLNVESKLSVGGALEQIAIVNNKLYVTNSANFQYQTANNSSVSVVDLNTFTKLYDIPVGFNPNYISATNAGDLFVVTNGNYSDILPSLDKLSSVTDKKVSSNTNVSLGFLGINGAKGFVIGDYTDPYLKVLNLSTGEVGANFLLDPTLVKNPYGVTVDTFTTDVFVSDSNGGSTTAFSADGKKKYSFATAKFPQRAVFKYKYN